MSDPVGPRPALEALLAHGVVPVVRTGSSALALRAVEWLREAGFSTFELTLTIPGAVGLIRELAADPALSVGAGTVLEEARARECIDAGARYLVSPALSAEIVAPCREAGAACVLGAATPSETIAAARLGADAVKIFPVSSLGGVAHIKALRSVFPQLRLAPTGGIGVDEIGAYLGAGAAFVGVGGRLVDERALETGARATVLAAARDALAQVEAARR